MGNLSKGLTLVLILTVAFSSLSLLIIEPVKAQSVNSTKEFSHLTHENFTLVPDATVLIQIQLKEGDYVEGSFEVSNFHYYPDVFNNGVLTTYRVGIKIEDAKYQTIYDYFPETHGSFNFTASNSGLYTIPCSCNYIYLVDNPIAPQLTMNFTVRGVAMQVNVLSPLTQLYTESNVRLSFTTNRFADWTSYNLDAKGNVTCDGNTTLTELSNGIHNLIIYSNDTYGNMDTKTVTFTIVEGSMFTTALIIIIAVPVVALSIVFYRRHRKTDKINQ